MDSKLALPVTPKGDTLSFKSLKTCPLLRRENSSIMLFSIQTFQKSKFGTKNIKMCSIWAEM